MRKIIALYDSDSTYAARFMEYFQNKQEFEWEVVAFTKKEKLESYLQEQQLELLLTESLQVMENLSKEQVKYSYQLTEEHQQASPDQGKICRYQSVERMMEQMLSDYMRRQDEISASINPNQVNIITVFSPVPGGQDAAFAWSLGFLLARQRKALFLPLDLFPLKLLDFIAPIQQGMSEFIYYLKEQTNTVPRWKELLNYSNNLAYLAGASHGFDVLSLNKEDIHRWIELLRTTTDYQTIVIYLSFYEEAGMELLKLSDRVAMIKGGSSYEVELSKTLERQLDCIGIQLQDPKFKSIPRTWERDCIVTYNNLGELTNSVIWQQAQEYLRAVNGGN